MNFIYMFGAIAVVLLLRVMWESPALYQAYQADKRNLHPKPGTIKDVGPASHIEPEGETIPCDMTSDVPWWVHIPWIITAVVAIGFILAVVFGILSIFLHKLF